MKYGRIEIVSRTATAVVTTSELKQFCYIDTTADDSLLAAMELAAVLKCESYCRRPFLVSTSCLWFDTSVYGSISIPFGKLNSIEKVSVFSMDGTELIIPSDLYIVDKSSDQGGRVYFKSPIAGTREINSVRIEFKNGWTSASEVPSLVKDAIKSLVSFWYENREMYDAEKLPANISSKLQQYRVMRM